MYNQFQFKGGSALLVGETYSLILSSSASVPYTLTAFLPSAPATAFQINVEVTCDNGTTWAPMYLFGTAVSLTATNNTVGIDSPGWYRLKVITAPAGLKMSGFRKVG
jgi:hypothetical protein